MTKSKIIYTLLLLPVFGCNFALADNTASSEKGSSYVDQYGIVNVVYLGESRIVVSDVNLHFTFGSGFYKASGARISNIVNELKPGTPVKYHFYRKSSNRVLKDLKIISKREYENSQKPDRD